MSIRGGKRAGILPDFFIFKQFSVPDQAESHIIEPMRSHLPVQAVLILAIFSFSAAAAQTVHGGKTQPQPGIPHGCPVGTYQSLTLSRMLEGRFSTPESLRVLVVRVSFADLDFDGGGEGGVRHDSLYFANELRHLAEYFAGASQDRFGLDCELAAGTVRLSRGVAYYGPDDLWGKRVSEILMEVVEEIDSSVDFSRYDAFAVIHSGPGRETDFNGDSPQQLLSGFVDPWEMEEILEDTLGTPGIPTADSLGGEPFFIDNLMVWPEQAAQDGRDWASLGIYAYQIGLRLGMIPLFDTTPQDFYDSQGIGTLGLMSWGLYNGPLGRHGLVPAFPCAFNRYLMGWVEPKDIVDDSRARLRDINRADPGDTVLLRIPVSQTEYFLVANRVHDTDFDGGFDFVDVDGDGIPGSPDTLLGAEFDFYLTRATNPVVEVEDPPGSGEFVEKVVTGSGLYIWHIDEWAIVRALESGGYPNDDSGWKGVDLEEADGLQDLDRPGGKYSFGSHNDSFRKGNNDAFGPSTEPSSRSNSGAWSGVEIRGISEAGEAITFEIGFGLPYESVTASFGGTVGDLSPVPADLNGDGFDDLLVAADTGLIYSVPEACDPVWGGDLDTFAFVPGAVWAGSPVLADIDGDDLLEVFITSEDGFLHAFESNGLPCRIDDDDTPGSRKLHGEIVSAPIVVQADVDLLFEVLALSSTEDSIFGYVAGFEHLWPADGREAQEDGLQEFFVCGGRLASHPTRGVVRDAAGSESEFLYFARMDSAGALEIVTSPLSFPAGGQATTRQSLLPQKIHASDFYGNRLLTPAAGDIDRDGFDELVISIPGAGLVYCEEPGICHNYPLRGVRPSPPVLADVDRDGALDAAVRDESYMYLLAGFGSIFQNWPLRLPEGPVEREQGHHPPPPIVEDLNGDGSMDLLFRAGTDLYALDSVAFELPGWPLPGGDYSAGSPALASGPAGTAFLFIAGSAEIVGGGEPEIRHSSSLSYIKRYHLTGTSLTGRGWPMHRRDRGGSGRQGTPELQLPRDFLDPSSFIVYPNPVKGGSFVVRISVSAPVRIRTEIFNLEGQKVLEQSGNHAWPEGSNVPFEEKFSTSPLASGIYICRIELVGRGGSWRGSTKFAVVR